MKIISKLIVTAACLLISLIAGAQALKGSYFLDNSLNRNKMNPAFTPRSNYFQVPVLGNISAGAMSNLDVPTFLYPMNGELLTFLNNQVPMTKFDKALPRHPHFDVETSSNIVNFGFFTKQKSFWTFDLGVKAGVDTDLPADFFMFLKKGTGTTGQSYNVGNINAYASASLQAALGYSRDIIDGLRVGAKVRAIVPVAYLALNMENMRLTTSKEKWTMESEGYLHTAVPGLDIAPVEDEMMPEINFDLDRLQNSNAHAGLGFSIDLGAEYVLDLPGELFDGISISASVTDLGAVRYKKDMVRSFSTEGKVDWTGIQNGGMAMEDVFDDLMESAEGLVNLKEEKASGLTRSTMPNVYVGAEVPFLYKKMSVGLLYSGRFSHSYYRNELTASLNITPAKWFALGVNYSFLNTARTIGGILEFTPKAGLNFFLGFDYLPLAYTSAPMISEDIPKFLSDMGFTGMPLPLSWRMNCHFGFAFSLGSKYGR